MSLLHHDARQEAWTELSCFRGEFHSCLSARSDALSELADAVLCGDGPVRSLAELSLVGEHRRGHGGLYAASAHGRVDAGGLRRALAEVPLPRAADGRLVLAVTDTRLYGTATARSWNRLHPELTHRSSWAAADGTLPIVEGAVIRRDIDHLPSGATPKPVWLWWSGTDATDADTDRLWQAYLRRFDIEHTFRPFKQTLGWTSPKIRTPQAADRWTWLILAACTQLRLARPLAADLRRPWEKPTDPDRLTPARVRRDFRHTRPKTACPARAPKPSRPGPGRPPGRKNTRPTPRHDVHTPRKTQPAKHRTKKSTAPRPHRTSQKSS